MMTKTKIVILALALVLTAVLVTFFAIYAAGSRDGFTGNRVRNPDAYILDIEYMNGSDSHTLDLKAGDALAVHFETEKGSLKTEIRTPRGDILYAGDGKTAADFTLNIPESGTYTVTVRARHARGKINIRK